MPSYGVQLVGGAARLEIIEGTPFGVVYPLVAPTPSGPAIGSLVAGIASILVSFLVACFGLTGSSQGWGPAVAGAFAVLAGFIGGGAIGLGISALRKIRRSEGTVTGRGMAIAGISCGGTGLAVAALSFVISAVATAGNTT
jgi:hypothetical protein